MHASPPQDRIGTFAPWQCIDREQCGEVQLAGRNEPKVADDSNQCIAGAGQ